MNAHSPLPSVAAALTACVLTVATPCQQGHAELAAKILDEGSERSQVMRFQDELCHDIGSRLTGSLAFDRAADWALAEFRAMGLDARLEQWGEWKVGWDREQWMGRMLEPEVMELQVACPAWTEGTRGIARGALVRMPTDAAGFEALTARADEGDELWIYGALPRDDEPRELALALLDHTAVHGIVQSATSTRWNDRRYENQIRVFGDRNAALREYDERQKWSQAVVRDDQCEKLEAALDGDAPVRVAFELRNRWRKGPVALNNVVADLVGSEYPEQFVVVCAHLDSWHQATGATDNGTGTCSTLETARILTSVGLRPKRTIRFILWGGEEQGLLGSRQYVVQNRTRMHRYSAVFNHDSGTNWAQSVRVAKSHAEAFERIIAPITAAMTPPESDFDGPVFELNVVDVMEPAGGGSDHASFAAVGVPAFSWRLRGPVPYGRGWHSQWDTWTIVRPDFQKHNATVFAVVAAGVANLDEMLSREGVERATPGGRRSRVDANLIVETWLGVELDGTTLKSISSDGAAAANELRAGDRLVAVEGKAVEAAIDLLAALREAASAKKAVTVTVARGGEEQELSIRL